ncbi:Ribosomal protein S12p Asp88 methylthiotransferase [Mucinivorans hirudinis]|uniref:Ribosomal protein uS12 methylthiotransferase RimO n=1 Tax=Mucinivorans hirudinis TaxID=1433126 RepID=A0A060RCB4_9BACT|nr:Ribosomal protein S12p Asp88 methylthiotransferase [Mucinivorans hirudinis]
MDSEHLMGSLEAAGWQVRHDPEQVDGNIVVINTCGFILDAKEESIEMILNFAAAKAQGRIEKLYVVGCLSERYKDELAVEIPEVDEFFGVNNLNEVLGKITELPITHNENQLHRKLTTPRHYAYLKISEGCNWGCGYCAIPIIRGKHISVPAQVLVREARELARRGVKELIVIGQDTTYYGLDLYGERKLGFLLEELCKIEGIEWVRLHYAYPTQFPDDVIDIMRVQPKICKYLDIPFQHISDNILHSMRRGITKEQTYDLIERLRREIPDIALRTTLLVGYPNETEQDFAELLEFVERVKFERLGVFPYSPEEGTHSALTMSDNVPEELKERRAEQIMALQQEISRGANERLVGTKQRVIIDRKEGDYYVARTQYDSPEVDNEVLVTGKAKVGAFDDVEITAADDYEIFGVVITK